jgi:hypothetical protein
MKSCRQFLVFYDRVSWVSLKEIGECVHKKIWLNIWKRVAKADFQPVTAIYPSRGLVSRLAHYAFRTVFFLRESQRDSMGRLSRRLISCVRTRSGRLKTSNPQALESVVRSKGKWIMSALGSLVFHVRRFTTTYPNQTSPGPQIVALANASATGAAHPVYSPKRSYILSWHCRKKASISVGSPLS